MARFGRTFPIHNRLVTAPPQKPTLIAAWAFDENTGSTTADGSGHGHTLTNTVSPGTELAWTSSGKYNAGVQGSSAAGYSGSFGVPQSDWSGWFPNNNVTVMMWAKAPAVGSGIQPLFSAGGATAASGNFDLWLWSTPSVQVLMHTAASGTVTVSYAFNWNTDNNWHHWAYTWDGTTCTLYKDGVSVATATGTGVLDFPDTDRLGVASSNNWGGTFQFAGTADDVRVYGGKVLTAAQITTCMGVGVGTQADPLSGPPPSTPAGSLTLGGSIGAAAAGTSSGSLTLGGSAAANAPATTAGSLTLGGSATWNEPAAGSLTLGGTVQAGEPAAGSVTLGGSETWNEPAAGSLTLGGSVAWDEPASGSISLGGSAAWNEPAAGSLTLGGTDAWTGQPAGSLTLGGTIAWNEPAAGSITLAGVIQSGLGSAGSLTLAGTVAWYEPAAGSVSLTGSVGPTAQAAATGSVTLGGSAAAGEPAAGSLTLGGTAVGQLTSAPQGSITLNGQLAAQALATLAGQLALAGLLAGTGKSPAGGSVTLAGTVGAGAKATLAGGLTLGATATGTNPGALRDVTIVPGPTATAWSSPVFATATRWHSPTAAAATRWHTGPTGR